MNRLDDRSTAIISLRHSMRRRLFVRTALMIGLAATAALACSPTTPCDPRASSGFNVLQFSCDPAGSDAQCQAMAENDNLYTCGPTSADVTSTATFISSDPSVAVFGAPGRAPDYLTTVGSGPCQCHGPVFEPARDLGGAIVPDAGSPG
jgi:hypothetical protein